jgi:hypothetical protein
MRVSERIRAAGLARPPAAASAAPPGPTSQPNWGSEGRMPEIVKSHVARDDYSSVELDGRGASSPRVPYRDMEEVEPVNGTAGAWGSWSRTIPQSTHHELSFWMGTGL